MLFKMVQKVTKYLGTFALKSGHTACTVWYDMGPILHNFYGVSFRALDTYIK